MNSLQNKFIKYRNNNVSNNMRKSISYDSIQYQTNKYEENICVNPMKDDVYIYREKVNVKDQSEKVIAMIGLTQQGENVNVYNNMFDKKTDIFIDIELNNDIIANSETNDNKNDNKNIQPETSINEIINTDNIDRIHYYFSFREKIANYCYVCINFRLCGFNPFACIVFLPLNLVEFIRKYKTVILNHLISIFLHIFLMIIFEIYFYFNYVIVIEKEVFLKKIKSYFADLNNYNHNKYNPFGVALIVNQSSIHGTLDTMHKNYEQSLNSQKNLLSKLLYQSCKLAFFFGLVLIILWFFGLCYYKNIKWKTIILDNILMLGLLGCFEYIFFTTIIMNYNPITDAEIEYLIVKNIYNYAMSNDTDYNNMTTTIINVD